MHNAIHFPIVRFTSQLVEVVTDDNDRLLEDEKQYEREERRIETIESRIARLKKRPENIHGAHGQAGYGNIDNSLHGK